MTRSYYYSRRGIAHYNVNVLLYAHFGTCGPHLRLCDCATKTYVLVQRPAGLSRNLMVGLGHYTAR